MIEELHKPEAVAPRVGLSLQAFYAACRQKQFPHVRIGKRIRIPETALQRWIEEQLNGASGHQPVSARPEAP